MNAFFPCALLRGLVPRSRVASAIVALAMANALGCSAQRSQPRASLQPPPEAAIVRRVEQYGPAARGRLAPYFARADVAYPPERFVLLAFKRERELHLLASSPGRPLSFIRSYRIRGASGRLGPKLREGDRQVPEGIYTIDYLNPHSVAHLSLALSYPNEFDRARASEDGRRALGGAIMIHGGSSSAGCLAIGDEPAEDVFVLAAESDWRSAFIIVSPVDFRRSVLSTHDSAEPPWVESLYSSLVLAVEKFPSSPATSTRRLRKAETR